MTAPSPAPTPAPAPAPDLEPVTTELNGIAERLDAITDSLEQPGSLDAEMVAAAWFSGWGTFIAAGASVLALFAAGASLFFLWQQVEQAKSSTKDQIDDQTWGRQIEALAKYLSLLHELNTAQPLTHEEAAERKLAKERPLLAKRTEVSDLDRQEQENERIVRELVSAGAIWRLLHRDKAKATASLEAAQQRILLAFGEVSHGTRRVENVRDGLNYFIEAVQEWQGAANKEPEDDKAQRAQEISTEVERKMEEYDYEPYER